MKTPFYLIDKYIYPSLRRRLVLILYRKGLTVSEIARRTGYSKSLVSRYIRGERGSLIDVSRYRDVDSRIREIAEKISTGKIDRYSIEAELGKLAIYMLWRKYMCRYHKLVDPEVDPVKCNICREVFGNTATT